MCDKSISDLPKFKKLEEEIKSLKSLKHFLPIMKLLGQDTSKLEEGLIQLSELEKNLEEFRAIPDEFNSIFSDQGWIFNETLNIDIAKQAIQTFKTSNLKKAESILVEYYSPEWVEQKFILLKFLPEFQERVYLGEKAVEDYKAGRYYSSVLLTILLIDGWVNDLNIVEFQRKGFYDKDSKLLAWDSITAHSKGLVKLQKVFSKGRNQTRTEEISIPFRNGIVHGMDLGFDNKIVAAKNWAALFCVRDWVLKVRNNEVNEPKIVQQEQPTLQQTITKIKQTQEDTNYIKNWEPHYTIIGDAIPPTGKASEYPENTPIRILVQFLEYWKQSNYGYMTNLYAPMLNVKPHEVRDLFLSSKLIKYKIKSIYNKFPWATDIEIEADLLLNNSIENKTIEFKMICNSVEGDLIYVPKKNSVWGILGRSIA